jgi:hypothetical protein
MLKQMKVGYNDQSSQNDPRGEGMLHQKVAYDAQYEKDKPIELS